MSESPARMRDLVQHLARHRRGLALLHIADLESAAVILGVDALSVARARETLATPGGRAWLISEVRRARAELQGATPGAPAPAAAAAPPPPRTAGELVHAAAEHDLGLAFLREGDLECVAVVFHVSPKQVLRARALLERFERRSPRGT